MFYMRSVFLLCAICVSTNAFYSSSLAREKRQLQLHDACDTVGGCGDNTICSQANSEVRQWVCMCSLGFVASSNGRDCVRDRYWCSSDSECGGSEDCCEEIDVDGDGRMKRRCRSTCN